MTIDDRNSHSDVAGSGETANVRLPQKGVFSKEGDYWTVGYGGTFYRLKDAKGLVYIAQMLRHPTVSFHVLDLVGGAPTPSEESGPRKSASGLPQRDADQENAGIHVAAGLGDAGEMLDDQAKMEYRRRLSELREDLEEAKDLGNEARAEQIEVEIDALVSELSRAVGLSGRDRRAASASERARQSVTKTVKAVIERIAHNDAALGDLLSRCIQTGTYCTYHPDPDFPIAWEFGAPAEVIEERASNLEPAPRVDHAGEISPLALPITPTAITERTLYVGREAERGTLRAALDRALGGHGSLVMLEGGPGVGKTRLAIEMADYAGKKGFQCSLGRCYERDEPFPYLPFVEIVESNLAQAASLDDFRRQLGDNAAELARLVPSLRRIFPDIPEALELPSKQKRRFLFQNISEAFARAALQRPQCYIVDDLHWADESSLALLFYLTNRIALLPIVIIATFRNEFSESNPALVRTLEELIRLGIRPLRLGGLSSDGVTQMLGALSDRDPPASLVSTIFEETQGNPFFVEEMYRHLVEEGKIFDSTGEFRSVFDIEETDVPQSVRLIIGRRLERLDEEGRRVLAAAGVIGRSFSFQLLSLVSAAAIEQLFTILEKAQLMGIVVASSENPESPFTFTHELVRQTLMAGISAPRRQQLYASVASAIERLDPHAVDERAGEVADHLLKAKSFADPSALVRWLTLAGKRALQVAAYEEARRSFQSALSHADAIDPKERAALLTRLSVAHGGLEQWDALLANLYEALEIRTGLGDPESTGRSFADLAEALLLAGNFEEAIKVANRGLDYLGTDLSADRVRLLAALGQARAAGASYEPALESLQQAVELSHRLTNPTLSATVLRGRAIVYFHFFRLHEALADGLESERLDNSGASPWLRALHLRTLHQTLLYLGRPEAAAQIADQIEPLAHRIGQSYSVALCMLTRGWTEFGRTPDFTKFEHAVEQSAQSLRTRHVVLDILVGAQRTLLDFFRGDWPSALSHTEAASNHEHGNSIEGCATGMMFRLKAYTKDREGALAILDMHRKLLPRPGRPNTRGSWLMLASAIEGLIMLGEMEQAAQLYPLTQELIETGATVLWPISRFTATVAGLAAAASGQYDVAEEHFQSAMRQAESFPHCLEQAEIRRFHAMMLIDRGSRGDLEKGKILLDEALKSYGDMGTPRHLEMTRAHLDRIALS